MSGTMKKISGGCLALLICSLLIVLWGNRFADGSIEEQLDSSLASIHAAINKGSGLSAATSSNPYDYVKDNPDFEKIVALGHEALPGLYKRLIDSDKNGLEAYMLAIAIETIAKVDLKQNESTAWATAHMFKAKWPEYVKSIPALVETITADPTLSMEEKVNRLIALGTLALPFLLDKIVAGDEALFPAVTALTDPSMRALKNTTPREWALQHKDQFSLLKRYVLDQ